MVLALLVAGCVLCALVGFTAGWTYAHRRLPDTLAAMTPEELRALAQASAARRQFPDQPRRPAQVPDGRRVAERVAAAEADVDAGRMRQQMAGPPAPDGAQVAEAAQAALAASAERARNPLGQVRVHVSDGARVAEANAAAEQAAADRARGVRRA